MTRKNIYFFRRKKQKLLCTQANGCRKKKRDDNKAVTRIDFRRGHKPLRGGHSFADSGKLSKGFYLFGGAQALNAHR